MSSIKKPTVKINKVEPKKKVEKKKDETVTITTEQLSSIMEKIDRLEANQEKKGGAILKDVNQYTPIFKVPIWHGKLVLSRELKQKEHKDERGYVTYRQEFELLLDGDKEPIKTDLKGYANHRKQIPARYISEAYKKNKKGKYVTDSDGNRIVDTYTIEIVDYTIQRGKKRVSWNGNIPKDIIGKEYKIKANLINS